MMQRQTYPQTISIRFRTDPIVLSKIVPIAGKPKKRMPGSAKGKVVIKGSFDAPPPKHILKVFEK